MSTETAAATSERPQLLSSVFTMSVRLRAQGPVRMVLAECALVAAFGGSFLLAPLLGASGREHIVIGVALLAIGLIVCARTGAGLTPGRLVYRNPFSRRASIPFSDIRELRIRRPRLYVNGQMAVLEVVRRSTVVPVSVLALSVRGPRYAFGWTIGPQPVDGILKLLAELADVPLTIDPNAM